MQQYNNYPDNVDTKVAEFLKDLHTPKGTGELTFNTDTDYTDYQRCSPESPTTAWR